jgi:hypothetical protein
MTCTGQGQFPNRGKEASYLVHVAETKSSYEKGKQVQAETVSGCFSPSPMRHTQAWTCSSRTAPSWWSWPARKSPESHRRDGLVQLAPRPTARRGQFLPNTMIMSGRVCTPDVSEPIQLQAVFEKATDQTSPNRGYEANHVGDNIPFLSIHEDTLPPVSNAISSCRCHIAH